MGLKIQPTRRIGTKITTLIAVFALVMQPMYGLVANASAPIAITNSAELCSAIKNQADGQVWQLAPGAYPIGPSNCTNIPVVDGNTNLYVPITADNLTITGIGNPTVYGSGFTTNGDGGFDGDFISITGDNVSIKNLTVMTKVYPNKVIEVRGSNSIIENVSIKPNTLGAADIDPSYYPAWSAEFAGSIYYHQAGGTHTLTNVSILNGGISLRSAGATFNLNNVHLTYNTNSTSLNTYRVYSPSGATINGLPTYTYQVSHALNNIDSVIAAIADPVTVQGTENIKLVSDIYLNKQLTINKPNVTIDGKKAAGGNYTIFGNFDKTDNSNNSLLGVQANGTKIKNLNVNGQNRQLHGVNVYEATGVELTDVALSNNAHAGMIVGKDANVTVNNITTTNNGWYGINVDKKSGTSAILTVLGTSSHDEDSTAHIWIDNRSETGNTVNDPNAQYARYWQGNGYQYLLDRTKPTTELTVTPFNPVDFKIKATDDQRLTRIDYSIWKNNDTTQIGVWGHPVDWSDRNLFEKTLTQFCDRSGNVNNPCVFKNFSDLGEGTYTLRATATDVMGKQTNAETRQFVVDRTAPKFSIESPANGQPVSGTIVLDAKITDDSDITKVLMNIGGISRSWTNGSSSTITRTDDVFSTTVDTSILPEGPVYVTLRGTDGAGNTRYWNNNAKNRQHVFYVDRTAPAIAITSATPSEVRGTVDADATEIWVKVGSGPEQRATYAPGETTWTLTISPALTAGADVIARAVDAANNTNSASTNPKWATRTIYVTTDTRTSVTNNPLVSGNGTPSQGGSSAILANTTPTLQVTSPVADTTDETGDVAGAATVNKDSEDKGQVLATEDAKDSWSLINLLLTIAIGVASIISLLGLLGSSRKDRKLTSRLLTIVPAAGAVVALLLIEDFSGSMIWVNIWSLLIGALAVIQMIILGMSKTTTNE